MLPTRGLMESGALDILGPPEAHMACEPAPVWTVSWQWLRLMDGFVTCGGNASWAGVARCLGHCFWFQVQSQSEQR